jgi:menaquinone-specific isochorismate synthase
MVARVSSPHVIAPDVAAAPLTVRTVALDPSLVRGVGDTDGLTSLLLRLPPDGGLSWVRGGEDASALIGWGQAARLDVAGAERFSRAQRWWTGVVSHAHVADEVGLAGTGPVAFASFAFDSEPGHSVVIVPRVLIGVRGSRAWITVAVDGDDAAALRTADGELESVVASLSRPVGVPDETSTVAYSEGSRTVPEWESAVGQAVSRINAGELDKVVLARDVVASLDAPLDVRGLLTRLAHDYPSCWTFSVDGLVGATPELLVRREGDTVTSRVLAGTVRRSEDGSTDGVLAAMLLGSDKDQEEHEYAVRSVAAALAAHCTDLDVPSRPAVLRLANVAHLSTDVSGSLVDSAPVLALAASLHPTAAVCGTPTERAFAVIREIEGMDRGRYAGPVGWIDAHGDGELGIALRCASLEEGRTRLRLFAGCGIVAGSTPESELAESQAKLVAMRDALEPRTPGPVLA